MCYKDMIVLLRARDEKLSWLPLEPVVNQEMISMESDTLRGTQCIQSLHSYYMFRTWFWMTFYMYGKETKKQNM